MEVFMGFMHAFKFSQPGMMFMWAILLIGSIGVAIAVERFFYLTVQANINAPKFMHRIFELIKQNKVDEAVQLCDAAPKAALPYVIGAGLKVADSTQRAMQNAIDEASLEIIPSLEKRTSYLSMIANVGTMAGLTGTIYGLILCFAAIGRPGMDPAQKTMMLANGISAAMFTTLGGLFVAVPLTLVFAFLTNKTNQIIDEIDEYSVKLINLFGSR
jgi:biopolymer transport protein ExbB